MQTHENVTNKKIPTNIRDKKLDIEGSIFLLSQSKFWSKPQLLWTVYFFYIENIIC